MTVFIDEKILEGIEPETLRIWGDLPRVIPAGLRMPVRGGVSITEIEEADLPAYLEHFRSPDIHDWTLRIPHPYTRTDAREWLESIRAERTTGSRSRHLAVRTEGGLLIGGVGLEASKAAGQGHQAEVGYWLAKPLWGRGIMTEAIRVLKAYAFEHEFSRLTAVVFATNVASARVLEKNGFGLEATLKRHYVTGPGSYMDGRLYAALG